jgi:hypothetical protein
VRCVKLKSTLLLSVGDYLLVDYGE